MKYSRDPSTPPRSHSSLGVAQEDSDRIFCRTTELWKFKLTHCLRKARKNYFFTPFSSLPNRRCVSTENSPLSFLENSNSIGHGLEKHFVSDSRKMASVPPLSYFTSRGFCSGVIF